MFLYKKDMDTSFAGGIKKSIVLIDTLAIIDVFPVLYRQPVDFNNQKW